MKEIIELIVDDNVAGMRLDAALSKLVPNCSRAMLQRLIKNGQVKIDNKPCLNQRLKIILGAEISFELPSPESTAPIAEDFSLEIIYEDDHMVVINKPPDMVVHPAPGNTNGTVVNALLGRYPHLQEMPAANGGRPGIVHRLDKDTSGILVIAKTPESQFKLSKSFAERKVSKTYLALVQGKPRRPNGEIKNFIGRHPVNRKKMTVVNRGGKEAISHYHLCGSGMIDGIVTSVLSVNILTGRTHQIRVHLSSIGLPIIGDKVYGGKQSIIANRQMLHAWKLSIPHPISEELLELMAPPPEDFAILQQKITDKLPN